MTTVEQLIDKLQTCPPKAIVEPYEGGIAIHDGMDYENVLGHLTVDVIE